ncbi:putative E3 ubiquitin-protein ligase UBR7 [Channa argus]|uniref:Putative E3 ubiquitin-protein ligase UBR7 n=1 Tax=Channa argus TaxID=215402 RepID=A0A6G1QLQ6_CHAAH|nr:putative E3 ubiquitin-protein ligase UBR7 [Channa argus]
MTEEQTVSLVDVLEEDEELEEEASAVLAGSDSDHCSYPQGYVKRQALYACNTCTPKGGQPAGVCLACSYTCHEGHELFELYTKRNFRCDCGNRKFTDLQCKLHPDKDEVNSLNKYSQNFFGLYCTCSRPYPDPDDQVEDEMIQCVVCEDWLHGRHLGCVVPESVELQEMICESCMNKNPFLWTYAIHLAVPGEVVQVKEETGAESNKPEKVRGSNLWLLCSSLNTILINVNLFSRGHVLLPYNRNAYESLPYVFVQDDEIIKPTFKRCREEAEPSCRLEELQQIGRNRVQSGAVFWPSAWRSKLCCCNTCQKRLSEAGLSFLLDEADTVFAYEKKGKNNEQKHDGHDPLMSALDNLNRVQQLEIIHGYNDMKTELKDFLQRFAAEGKVVTPDDIRQFFEQQQTRKRRRVDAGRFYCA